MGREHGCKIDKKIKIDSQYVKAQCVKSQNVLESKIKCLETENLFVNGKPFPSSGSGYTITESTTIVGTNVPLPSKCTETPNPCITSCPTATPGTPSGGVFTLGASFTGKLTFCGVRGMELNLNGLIVTGNSEVAIEFINCDQVWVHGGSVNNANGTAVKVSCSSNLCFSRINSSQTRIGFLVEDSYDINIKNIYLNSTGGISFKCCNYMRFTNIDINGVSNYDTALIKGEKSEMIFMSNMAIYNINVENASGTKGIIKLDDCFDVKISHISLLTIRFFGISGQDLSVYLVHITNSGSMVLGSFIVDGDIIEVIGAKGTLNCLRLENCNNTFMAHHLMTDNKVFGFNSHKDLTFEGVHLTNMRTFTMNGSKICTNGVFPTTTALVKVRSFYGEVGGNWYLSGNICNENSSAEGSVYGFEIFNVDSTVVMQKCSGNNNGSETNAESGGFKVHTDNPINNNDTNILFVSCAANQNHSLNKTNGFLSTYSNTQILNSEAVSNVTENGNCYGYLLPGLVNGTQLSVYVDNCVGNSNLSASNGESFGLYADGVRNLIVIDSSFNSNGPPLDLTGPTGCVGSAVPNPGYGIWMENVNVSTISNNKLSENNWGLYVNGGAYQSINMNSAIYNDVGFQINQSPSSIVKKNLSQGNNLGFVDNTSVVVAPGVTLNSYFSNHAVANFVSSYNCISPTVIPWYEYDPSTGVYTLISGDPGITTFTNLSS